MAHIKLKNTLNEHSDEIYIQKALRESFDYDFDRLNNIILSEQNTGTTDVLKKVPTADKKALVQPLMYAVLDQLKKRDPKGFEQLKPYLSDPTQLAKIINDPRMKGPIKKTSAELVNLPVTEGDAEFEENFNNYLEEALYRQKTSPKNTDPSKKYDWSKSVEDNVKNQKSTGKPEAKPAAGGSPAAKPDTASEPEAKGKKSYSLVNIADKAGIAAIKGLGKAGEAVGKGITKLAQTSAGKTAGKAGMGIVSKVSSFMKKHPKLTKGAALALIVSIGTAAAIGSGGLVPLISGTVAAATAGAGKGFAIGSTIGAGKEMYNQIKGGATSFKDIDYKKVGKSAIEKGGKGAAIGAAVGGGANVLGKAALGAQDVFSGEYAKAMRGHDGANYLRDMTPGEKRALGDTLGGPPKMTNQEWAKQYDPNNIKTWKFKPSINSPDGYEIAKDKNDALFDAFKNNSNVGRAVNNYRKIAGELVRPDVPLSQNQLQAMKDAMDMGNNGYKLYGADLMRQYNAAMGR